MRHVFGCLVAATILVIQGSYAKAQEPSAPSTPEPSQPAMVAQPSTPAPGTITYTQPSQTYARRGLFGRRMFVAPTTPYTTTPATTYYYPAQRRGLFRRRLFAAPGTTYFTPGTTSYAPGTTNYTYSSAYQGISSAPAPAPAMAPAAPATVTPTQEPIGTPGAPAPTAAPAPPAPPGTASATPEAYYPVPARRTGLFARLFRRFSP